MALSPYLPPLRGTATSASVPPRLATPGPSLQPPCWPDGTVRPHVSFLYTLLPDAVCLGRLVAVYGGLLERQPCFAHIAREVLRALCDVDAMTTCDLAVVRVTGTSPLRPHDLHYMHSVFLGGAQG